MNSDMMTYLQKTDLLFEFVLCKRERRMEARTTDCLFRLGVMEISYKMKQNNRRAAMPSLKGFTEASLHERKCLLYIKVHCRTSGYFNLLNLLSQTVHAHGVPTPSAEKCDMEHAYSH
jgi:hypothetical protein